MLESSSLYFLVMRNPYQIIYAFIHVINMLEQTSYGILVYILFIYIFNSRHYDDTG